MTILPHFRDAVNIKFNNFDYLGKYLDCMGYVMYNGFNDGGYNYEADDIRQIEAAHGNEEVATS